MVGNLILVGIATVVALRTNVQLVAGYGLVVALAAPPLLGASANGLTLTFLAGIVGMIVAILVAYLIPPMPLYSDIYKTANHEGDILLRASPAIMLVSFCILAVVGIVSGLLPAVRASRMDPVDALRHE